MQIFGYFSNVVFRLPHGKCSLSDRCHLMAKVYTQLLLSCYCTWWFFVIQGVKKWPLQGPDLYFFWTCHCYLYIMSLCRTCFIHTLLHQKEIGVWNGFALFQISLTIIRRQERAPLLSGAMESAVFGSKHSSAANLVTVIPFNFNLLLKPSWKCMYIFEQLH